MKGKTIHSNGLAIVDWLIGYTIESKQGLPCEKAWEALENAFPGIYKIEDLVQLSVQAWAVYD